MSGKASTDDPGARQVDWHLLLPQSGRPFNHLVLLGGSPALENTILDLGIARRVSHEPSEGGEADAVVILAGATGCVDTAVDQLTEEGVL